MAFSVLSDEQRERFEREDELDFSFSVQNLSRFRGNVFRQRGTVAMAMRQIPFKILGFDELGLPRVVGAWPRSPAGSCSSPGRRAPVSRRPSPRWSTR